MIEEGEEEDCAEKGQLHTDSQQEKPYKVQQIKTFLHITKNMKKVKVEDYFGDKELFLILAKSQMSSRESGDYTDQELYRLKKIILKQEIYNDEKLCKAVSLLSVFSCVSSLTSEIMSDFRVFILN